MLFTNANLSKNQLYEPNKQSSYHHQARRRRVLFQIFLHVILLSAIYFRVMITVGF